MPLTPFHLGPALLLGLVLWRQVNLPMLLLASVIVDIEPLAVLIFNLNYPLHGFFHSFLGGATVALMLSIGALGFRGEIARVSGALNLPQNHGPASFFLASILGLFTHTVLDSSLYPGLRPFYPLGPNPFFTGNFTLVYGLCVASFLLALPAYLLRR